MLRYLREAFEKKGNFFINAIMRRTNCIRRKVKKVIIVYSDSTILVTSWLEDRGTFQVYVVFATHFLELTVLAKMYAAVEKLVFLFALVIFNIITSVNIFEQYISWLKKWETYLNFHPCSIFLPKEWTDSSQIFLLNFYYHLNMISASFPSLFTQIKHWYQDSFFKFIFNFSSKLKQMKMVYSFMFLFIYSVRLFIW